MALEQAAGKDDYEVSIHLKRHDISEYCHNARHADQLLKWLALASYETPYGEVCMSFRIVITQMKESMSYLLKCTAGSLFIRKFFHSHPWLAHEMQFLPDHLADDSKLLDMCCDGGPQRDFKSRSALILALLAWSGNGCFSLAKLQTHIAAWGNLEGLMGSDSGVWILLRVLQARHDLHASVAKWLVSFPSQFMSWRCSDVVICLLINGVHDPEVQKLGSAFLERSNDEWDRMLFDDCQRFEMLATALYYFSPPLGIRIVERHFAAGWYFPGDMGLAPISDSCVRALHDETLSCTTCCSPRSEMSEHD